MIKPHLLLLYNFQLFIISLHFYSSTRHIYLILVGLFIHKISKYISTRKRFFIGNLLILLYLYYPFLYFLSFSYILSNTYYTISLLIKSVDLSKNIYFIELSSLILSFLLRVDYSLIFLFLLIDVILLILKISPPYESTKYQETLKRIKSIVKDYKLRKKEYRVVLSEYTIIPIKEEFIKKKKLRYLSIDLFTPVVLLKREMSSLLILIVRIIPCYKYDHLCFFFLFLYLIDFKVLSLIVSVFCDYSNIKNNTSRLISTVVLYYIFKYLN